MESRVSVFSQAYSAYILSIMVLSSKNQIVPYAPDFPEKVIEADGWVACLRGDADGADAAFFCEQPGTEEMVFAGYDTQTVRSFAGFFFDEGK